MGAGTGREEDPERQDLHPKHPIPTSTCKWEPGASHARTPLCTAQAAEPEEETAPRRDMAPAPVPHYPQCPHRAVRQARPAPQPGAPLGRPTGTLVDGGATAVLGEAAPPPQRVPIGQGGWARAGHGGPVRPAPKEQEERRGPTPSRPTEPSGCPNPGPRSRLAPHGRRGMAATYLPLRRRLWLRVAAHQPRGRVPEPHTGSDGAPPPPRPAPCAPCPDPDRRCRRRRRPHTGQAPGRRAF